MQGPSQNPIQPIGPHKEAPKQQNRYRLLQQSQNKQDRRPRETGDGERVRNIPHAGGLTIMNSKIDLWLIVRSHAAKLSPAELLMRLLRKC
jgi:hypothetical protein